MSEQYSTFGPICPHCEHQHRADEAFMFDEGTDGMDCEACDKPFRMRVYNSTSWTTEVPS